MYKYKINTTDGKSFVVLDNEADEDSFVRGLMSYEYDGYTAMKFLLQCNLETNNFESNYVAIKLSHICSVEYLGE